MLVEPAGEPRGVRVATGAADAVTTNAKHLTRTAVTTCARHRIEPRSLPVRIRGARGTRPAGGMRIAARRIDSGNPLPCMTVDAKELAVTHDAHTGLRRGLLIVNREEVGSMHRLAHG